MQLEELERQSFSSTKKYGHWYCKNQYQIIFIEVQGPLWIPVQEQRSSGSSGKTVLKPWCSQIICLFSETTKLKPSAASIINRRTRMNSREVTGAEASFDLTLREREGGQAGAGAAMASYWDPIDEHRFQRLYKFPVWLWLSLWGWKVENKLREDCFLSQIKNMKCFCCCRPAWLVTTFTIHLHSGIIFSNFTPESITCIRVFHYVSMQMTHELPALSSLTDACPGAERRHLSEEFQTPLIPTCFPSHKDSPTGPTSRPGSLHLSLSGTSTNGPLHHHLHHIATAGPKYIQGRTKIIYVNKSSLLENYFHLKLIRAEPEVGASSQTPALTKAFLCKSSFRFRLTSCVTICCQDTERFLKPWRVAPGVVDPLNLTANLRMVHLWGELFKTKALFCGSVPHRLQCCPSSSCWSVRTFLSLIPICTESEMFKSLF